MGGEAFQTSLASRASHLSFTSAQSRERATGRSSPEIMPSPTKRVSQPGPGAASKKTPASTIANPPTMLKIFRKESLPWLLC